LWILYKIAAAMPIFPYFVASGKIEFFIRLSGRSVAVHLYNIDWPRLFHRCRRWQKPGNGPAKHAHRTRECRLHSPRRFATLQVRV
jgi:hypothetical protein